MNTNKDYSDLERLVKSYTEDELAVPVSRVHVEEMRNYGLDQLYVTLKMRRIDKALSRSFITDLMLKITHKILDTGERRIPVINPVVARGQRIAKS